MNELRAYADGRWADFGGLDACTLAEADAQLGPRRSEQLHGGVFGGEPTQFAVYSGGRVPERRHGLGARGCRGGLGKSATQPTAGRTG